jgi:uncharacterized membrane protein YdbT with pleckstrin-like domain
VNGWRDLVLRFFRVPPEPEPPPGSAPRVFHAAPNYLALRTIEWAFSLVAILIGALLLTTALTRALGAGMDPGAKIVVVIFTSVLWVAFGLRLIVGYAIISLDFEMRWYMVSDRAIRIREGIVTVKEKTIAFANIQNISLKQGPLQRLLGIADVEVRTAGGGSAEGPHGEKEGLGEPMHIGYFRGVDDAEGIRDIVREGVRRQKDSGLGDPDEPGHTPHSGAEELLAEARLTRKMLERALGVG